MISLLGAATEQGMHQSPSLLKIWIGSAGAGGVRACVVSSRVGTSLS